MLSQKSVDGLLISALMKLHAIRFAKAHDKAVFIWRLKDLIAILCVWFTIIFLSRARQIPHSDASMLMVLSLCIPWVFGWFTGIWILKNAPIPKAEESALIADRIINHVQGMNTNYMASFLCLLYAVIDEDGSRSIELADELDAYGWDTHELTMLVRSVFS